MISVQRSVQQGYDFSLLGYGVELLDTLRSRSVPRPVARDGHGGDRRESLPGCNIHWSPLASPSTAASLKLPSQEGGVDNLSIFAETTPGLPSSKHADFALSEKRMQESGVPLETGN